MYGISCENSDVDRPPAVSEDRPAHALTQEDVLGATAPVVVQSARLQALKFSSRPLNWGPLNIERRKEPHPGRAFFPAGTIEHLIFARLSDYYVRESNAKMMEGQYLAGQVSIHPARIPIRWEWKSKVENLLITLSPS